MTLAFGWRFWTSASVCKHTWACTSLWTVVLNLQCVLFPPGGGSGWHRAPPALFTSRLISTLGVWQSEKRDPVKGQSQQPVWTTRPPLHLRTAGSVAYGLYAASLWIGTFMMQPCSRIAFCGGSGAVWCRRGEYLRGERAAACQIPHAAYVGNYAPRIQMRSGIASWDNFNDNSTFFPWQIIRHTWKNPDWSSLHLSLIGSRSERQ